MLTNEFVKRGDTYGYVDSSGKFCTGWVVISNAKNQVKYLNPNGKGFLTNTSRVIDVSDIISTAMDTAETT